MSFPKDFVWGAASSAYQIEGGWDADGKGPSTWDAYCHQEAVIPPTVAVNGLANVFMGHTGDVGCDHFHQYREDVGLMKEIGLRAYRFSISWPRVMPDGIGAVNAKGLGFYDKLVDELLATGITPYATLFHWDLPLGVYNRGGWLNRDIAGWFADYASVVVEKLSDRVKHWMTINEPQIFLGPSENEGLQTSNARKGHAERLLAAHNTLLAHGRGVQAIRARAKAAPTVGWAPIGRVKVPATNSAADLEAAKRATLGVLAKDFWNNAWFADPIVFGTYPEDGLRLYGKDAPKVHTGDMETIKQKIDFYGINVYDAERYRMSADGKPEKVDFPPGHPQTAVRWFIEPEALYWGPRFLYERYRVPMMITENGLSNTDWVMADGKVHDPQRIDYTRAYLLALSRAIKDGADVRGYFHWSIMDNFEWQSGYKERFGLIHIDYATGKRTVKESGRWYRGVIESNGAKM